MTLSRPIKVLIGILTIWPIAYMLLFVGFVAVSFLTIAAGEPGHLATGKDGPPVWFFALMVAHVGTMLIALALTAFYIVYLFKTDQVAEGRKALWAVVLFMGGFIAQPVFFCLYVWPERKAAAKPPSLPGS